jgi:osmoprotectant transport system ATP-binding protein
MIELDQVTKRFDASLAVANVSLAVRAGELFVLIGPSGSGKSTLLRMINRLVPLSSGTIRFAGEDVMRFPAEQLRRRIGYVIQSIGLFPHWTVERNIATVPELLGWPPARIRDRATELLRLLGLEPERFRSQYPHQLSGGQQQRVGVARALAADPDVLLMDEPFGALDPITRAALQGELAALHRASGKTILFVTHDMAEALRLASRIALLKDGRVVQVGTPHELLTAPADDFVLRFVGGDDRFLQVLSVLTVASRVRRGEAAPGEPVIASATLREALAQMLARGTDRLSVAGTDGGLRGAIHLSDLVRR